MTLQEQAWARAAQKEYKKLFEEGEKISLSSYDMSRVNLSLLENRAILIVWRLWGNGELERIDLSSEKLESIKKEASEASAKNVSDVSDDESQSGKDWLKKHDVDKTSWNE